MKNMPKRFRHTVLILETMSQFTPMQTRQKLVASFIVPQFLYCDIIFLHSLTRLCERLKFAFNSSPIFGISYYEHIST
jgi:hypothetical protein